MESYYSRMRGIIGSAPLMVAGAVVIIVRNGSILLQRRRDDGRWAHHGGAMEQGEDITDSARRELFEETGLTAHSLRLVDAMSFEHVYPDGNQVFDVLIIYICNDFSGELRPEAGEVLELRWFAPDELPLPQEMMSCDVKINERLLSGEYGGLFDKINAV